MAKKAISFIFHLVAKWIPILLFSYLLLYAVVYLYAYRVQLLRMNSEAISSTDAYSSEARELIKQKVFLSARLEMAGSDSIGLTVNLRDSLIQIELKGVVMRQLKFERADIPKFFQAINPESYSYHFSKPFTIESIEGAIVKEPVTVRKVPKDSLEAAAVNQANPVIPDEFVEWHVLLNNSFVISFVQDEKSTSGGNGLWRYRFGRYRDHFTQFNRQLLRRQLPDVHPEITVYMPAGDAKAFYRALPPSGQVVVVL